MSALGGGFPDHLKGRAIAVAMVSTPLALSLGIPASALIGSLLGWRNVFLLVTALSLALIGWAWAKLPDYPGKTNSGRVSIRSALAISGIKSILLVTLLFVLAHNILYTYIAPLVAPAGLSRNLDAVLLMFGITAIAGIGIVGHSIGPLAVIGALKSPDRAAIEVLEGDVDPNHLKHRAHGKNLLPTEPKVASLACRSTGLNRIDLPITSQR